MKTFLHGPAGSGKTSRGVARLEEITSGTNQQVLVYVPQKTLAGPYYSARERIVGLQPDILTIGGLSNRMVELFWPMVSGKAGFQRPASSPIFLNLESAQYFMAQVVQPLRLEGLFESVTINTNRLYTQILDNLNKAALNGYDLEILGDRLKLGSVGDPEQMRIFQDALVAAQAYREFCLQNNLVDFSLQISIFFDLLWKGEPHCREYLQGQYQHLIVDNLEETTPIEHDIIREWLPEFESAFLIFDDQAGYRTFLGADPVSAVELKFACDQVEDVSWEFASDAVFESLSLRLGTVLDREGIKPPSPLNRDKLDRRFVVLRQRYFPEMLENVADMIQLLIEDEAVSPSEIVVLSPFLSDALRYSLSEKLAFRGIRSQSHRPSRSLRDEPVSQALFTLASLAHPEWKLGISKFDLAYALLQILGNMDLIRAQLLAESVIGTGDRQLALQPFGDLSFVEQERITYLVGERYEKLREWLERYSQTEYLPLDHFWSMVFGEVLSQPGFGFHNDLGVGQVAANLIDSARNFRLMNQFVNGVSNNSGKEYLMMMQEGVVAAQYLRNWFDENQDAVSLFPAYTFLMRNQPVTYQFWLDIGSRGWHERIYQPLTHPHTLNRNWPIDNYWTDLDEQNNEKDALFRLVTGLLRRCKAGVFVAMSDLSESGYETEGLLTRTLHAVYQSLDRDSGVER